MQPEKHTASSFLTCRMSFKPTRGSKYWTCNKGQFSVQGNLVTTKLGTSSWCLRGSEVNCCVYHSTRHQNTLLRCYSIQRGTTGSTTRHWQSKPGCGKSCSVLKAKVARQECCAVFSFTPKKDLKGKSNEKRLLPSSLLTSWGNISALFRKWCKPIHGSVE